jgi:hypothetical protein
LRAIRELSRLSVGYQGAIFDSYQQIAAAISADSYQDSYDSSLIALIAHVYQK